MYLISSKKAYQNIAIILAMFVYVRPALSDYTVSTAKYSLHSKGLIVAEMQRHHMTLANGNHKFSSETKTVGLAVFFRDDHIIETTEWKQNENIIEPVKYSYQHTSKKKNRKVEITFDKNNQRIINSINDDKWTLPYNSGVYDKLLYQIVLKNELMTGIIPDEYAIADGGKIKAYRFSFLGKETIQTKLGDLETIKLSLHKDNKERKTILWCAESLGFLPVKVENTEKNGDQVTAIIESLESQKN